MASSPLRVTFVIKGLGPGGAERLLVETARQFDPSLVEPSVIYALTVKQHLVGELRESGVEVRGLDVQSLADPTWLVRLANTLRGLRPDVIHVHSPAMAPIVRAGATLRLFGRPRPAIVSTEHNAWSTYHWLTRTANAATAALDDVTLAVSDEVRRSVYPTRLRRRVRTLRHGIDLAKVRATTARRDEVRAELGACPSDVVVVTVANYRAQKNYPSLIRTARLVTARNDRARFVAVGQGPLAAEVERLRDEAGLDDRLVLTGYRADATAVLAAGDVFTLASDYEGLPVALMEALALGLPVVATQVGGVGETIGPAAGRLVVPRDPVALAEALCELIADDELRARLARGAARLGDEFDAARTAATLTAIYRDVTSRRGG